MSRSVEIARAFITLDAETKGLDQQLSIAERALGRTAKFIQDNPLAAAAGLGTAAIAAGFELAKMAEETNKALGIIADRVPGATGKIDELRGMVNQLAIDFAIAQDKVIATMDAASRAGVKNGGDLVNVTTAALAAGRAIGEDGATLVGGLSAALKIFGINASSSTAAMVEFMAAAKGHTDVDAILDTVTKLAPAVAGTGLSFTTTLSAVTALLNEGFAPGKKLIAEFTKELKEGGVPAIEALAAKAPLASDAVQQFTDAIKRNTDSIQGENARAQASLHAQLVELGTLLEPLAAKVVGFLVNFTKYFHGIDAASIAATEGAMAADKAAAGALLAANTTAAAFDALGVSGGIAAGKGGALAAVLLEIKNESGNLGHASVADLTRYKTALDDLAASGQLDAAGQKLLTKVTDELIKKRKEEAAAALAVARDLLASRKLTLELETKYSAAIVTLADAQARAVEAIELDFGDKILRLKGDAKEKALALLADTKARTEAAWQSIGHVITEDIAPKVETTQALMVDSLAKLSTGHSDLNAIVLQNSLSYAALNIKYDEAIAKQQAHRQVIHDTATEVAGMVDGFGAFAKALGLSDPALDKVLKGVGDIADAIGKVASGNIGGGLISGISGLSGVIAGLFGGESESARKVRIALEQTQAELERHRQTLGDLIAISQPGAKVVNLQGGVNEILAAFKDMQSKGGVASVLTGIDSGRVAPILAKRGLSIDDLEKLAKDLGIDLHLGQSADFFSIAQLNALLQDIDTRDSGFAATFQGQLDKLTQRWNIIGAAVNTKLGDLVGLATDPTLGAPALRGLKDFNLNTDKGRAGATDFLAKLLENGNLTNKDLGGLDLQTFRNLLGTLATLIRDVGTQAQGLQATIAAEEAKIQGAGTTINTARAAEQDKVRIASDAQANAKLLLAAAQKVLSDPHASDAERTKAGADLLNANTVITQTTKDIAAAHAAAAETIASAQAIIAAATATIVALEGQLKVLVSNGPAGLDPLSPPTVGTHPPPPPGDPNVPPPPAPGSTADVGGGGGGGHGGGAIADPIFTPNLQAANWEELLGIERRVPDLLAQILGKIDFAPIRPPALPPGVLDGGPASGAGINLTFGDIAIVAAPGADGQDLLNQFLQVLRDPRAAEAIDAALAPRYQDALSLQGNITRSLS